MLAITRAVEGEGFYYAPDPSSQIACTIGGNVAENSGGLHCLKYGLTTNNLLGVKFVLPGGEIVTLGGKAPGAGGLDLLGVVTGSEGLLGMVVEATVRILRKAPVTRTMLASFDAVPDAGACVAAIIGDGIVPAAMEFMDRRRIGAVEAYNAPGYPADAEAILIIDADGVEAEVADAMARISDIVAACGGRLAKPPREGPRQECGRAARPPFPPWAACARHDLHGRHHPPPCLAAGAGRHRRDVEQYSWAAAMCFMPATATCIP